MFTLLRCRVRHQELNTLYRNVCVCTENRTRSGLICHQKIHAPYELHTFLCRVLQVREETIVNPPESVSDTSSARFASHCPPRLTSVTWVYPLNTYPLDSKYATLISVSTSDELHPEKLKKKRERYCSGIYNICTRIPIASAFVSDALTRHQRKHKNDTFFYPGLQSL